MPATVPVFYCKTSLDSERFLGPAHTWAHNATAVRPTKRVQLAAETVSEAVQKQHDHTCESTKTISKKCIYLNVEEHRVKHMCQATFCLLVGRWTKEQRSCRAWLVLAVRCHLCGAVIAVHA